jgi:integrase/recombinase XerD
MTQTQAVTPLRQRMLDDMKLRNMAASTRKVYVCSVAGFSAFHGRSPDELTPEDMRDYQLHLVTRGLKASIPSGRTAFPRAQTPRKRSFSR